VDEGAVFGDLGIDDGEIKDARCEGAGGNGINLGLNRKVEIVVAKKKPP